ncbi:MAG TPA: thioredoxin-like domain-containing protein [Planctomycetia bacterium]|nr:thioredoxin-like domain-containing protein [Planctomycetia bacterium]
MHRESTNREKGNARRWLWLAAAAIALAAFAGRTTAMAEDEKTGKSGGKTGGETAVDKGAKKLPPNPFPRRVPIPAGVFDGGVGWLNTAGPMPLPKLRGKIVVLDFWTYCCINCIHILADLEKLEAEFPNELVVIGVHSAKFTGEKDDKNIREAILRYGIKHPVVNDANHAIWNQMGVSSWPTLALIDPEGNFVGALPGEGRSHVLRAAIKELIEYHKAKGNLDSTPLHIQREELRADPSPLSFPGKVVAQGGKLYVADSSHHRLVIADAASGKVEKIVGAGLAGLKDGDFASARFNDPQGMAVVGDKIYLADRKNHALRLVDLAAGKVTTISGTGRRGFDRNPNAKSAKAVDLASPWDVLHHDGVLYIAMAGMHQIWSMPLAKPDAIGPFAGNGRENIADGARAEAEFAQPSGLSTDGEWLYVADSETSSVRAIGLKKDVVRTLIGVGLFEFGDKDGVPGAEPDKARLQHALGVAFDPKRKTVWIADTYNNKIKSIDPQGRAVKTLLGGKAGKTDDPPAFDEPGGLSLDGDKLYLADTNNGLIRVVDLESKKVATVALSGLQPPESAEPEMVLPPVAAIDVKPATLAETGPYRVAGKVTAPPKTKLNPEAPMAYKVTAGDRTLASGKLAAGKADFEFELGASLLGVASIDVTITFFPCETGSEGICKIVRQAWRIPVSRAAKGATKIDLPGK